MDDDMSGNDMRKENEQLNLLPREGIDWSRVEPMRRVWLEDIGGDHRARLEFLADQGLRLVMADLGPGEGETLHFFNPRDRETLHLRAGGGKSLLSEAARYFPSVSRWTELLQGEEKSSQEERGSAALPTRSGILFEVEGGRVLRVHESWRDYPQVVLYGTKTGQAGSFLEKEAGTEGTALAIVFVQALEDARGMKVPTAALALRTVLIESARAQGHLAWIGAAAAVLQRQRIAAKSDSLRRELEEGLEEWLGDPLGRGWAIPGGMKEGFPLEGATACVEKLGAAAAKWEELSPRVKSLPVPRWTEKRLHRLPGEAEASGWVGPLARAAGLDVDVRKEEPGVYPVVAWEGTDAPEGAGMFRRLLALKAGEVASSLEVARRILEDLPDDPLLVKRGRGGRGEGFGRCEGPEGETCCHVALEKGQISYVAFSLPRELNRSAARVLEGRLLDEADILSLLWENPPTPITG